MLMLSFTPSLCCARIPDGFSSRYCKPISARLARMRASFFATWPPTPLPRHRSYSPAINPLTNYENDIVNLFPCRLMPFSDGLDYISKWQWIGIWLRCGFSSSGFRWRRSLFFNGRVTDFTSDIGVCDSNDSFMNGLVALPTDKLNFFFLWLSGNSDSWKMRKEEPEIRMTGKPMFESNVLFKPLSPNWAPSFAYKLVQLNK